MFNHGNTNNEVYVHIPVFRVLYVCTANIIRCRLYSPRVFIVAVVTTHCRLSLIWGLPCNPPHPALNPDTYEFHSVGKCITGAIKSRNEKLYGCKLGACEYHRVLLGFRVGCSTLYLMLTAFQSKVCTVYAGHLKKATVSMFTVFTARLLPDNSIVCNVNVYSVLSA